MSLLGRRGPSEVSKKYDEPIEVETAVVLREGASLPGQPVAFRWRGRRYSVHRLLKYWREAGEAWDPERAKDHECYRVEADGGTYDLRLDRLAGRSRPTWRLARVWD